MAQTLAPFPFVTLVRHAGSLQIASLQPSIPHIDLWGGDVVK